MDDLSRRKLLIAGASVLGASALGKNAYAMSADDAIRRLALETGASEADLKMLVYGRGLSTSDVESDRSRLEQLVFRTSVSTPNKPKQTPTNVPWMFGYAISSPDGRAIRGIARTQQWPRDHPIDLVAYTERDLEWDFNPNVSRRLDNPARPMIANMNAARNDLSSDLEDASSPYVLDVVVNPTADDSPNENAYFRLDNRIGGSNLSTKLGRPMEEILTSTHAHDYKQLNMYDLLLRTVRIQVMDNGNYSGNVAHNSAFIVYPGTVADSFKIDMYSWHGLTGEYLGKMGIDMQCSYDGADKLNPGFMKVDTDPKRTALAKVVTFCVVQPKFDQKWDYTGGFSSVGLDPGYQETPIDWDQLLEGTAWLQAPK